MNKLKLSPTMHKAIDLANEAGGKLVYMRGGWWIKPGTPTRVSGYDTVPDGPSVGSSTITALIERGVLKITARGWNDLPAEVTVTERVET